MTAPRLKEKYKNEIVAKLESELQKAATNKELALQTLKSQLDATSVSHQLAISEAVGKVQQERDTFKNHLDRAALEKELAEKSLKDKYETEPPRFLRRLKSLRGLSHEEVEQVFP